MYIFLKIEVYTMNSNPVKIVSPNNHQEQKKEIFKIDAEMQSICEQPNPKKVTLVILFYSTATFDICI